MEELGDFDIDELLQQLPVEEIFDSDAHEQVRGEPGVFQISSSTPPP